MDLDFKIHLQGDFKIVEITSEGLVVSSIEDGTDLLGNIYYQDLDKVILHEKNITPAFFDLKTGIAGEILQKFSNYRVRLAIVGDFSAYQGKSIRDFIYESNQFKQINFVGSVSEAIESLIKA